MAEGMRREPTAYAKLATRHDVLPPFYITDEHVKESDEYNMPTRIEVVLGRRIHAGSLQAGTSSADFQYGPGHPRISKMHALIYWNNHDQCFEIKSICKKSIKVNGMAYPGPQNDQPAVPCKLTSKSRIEIADGVPVYFLLPTNAVFDKPNITYERLAIQSLSPDKELTAREIILDIQCRYSYYSDENIGPDHTWKKYLRSVLASKHMVFKKIVKIDSATGRRLFHWILHSTARTQDTGCLPPPSCYPSDDSTFE